MLLLISLIVAAALCGSCLTDVLANQTGDGAGDGAAFSNGEVKLVFEGLHRDVVYLNDKESVIAAWLIKMERRLDMLAAECRDRNMDRKLEETLKEMIAHQSKATAAIEERFRAVDQCLDALPKKLNDSEIKDLAKPAECTTCFDVMKVARSDGVYSISAPPLAPEPFDVFCANSLEHGRGWTVVLRRKDGSADFNRPYSVYRQGFGNLNVDFFIGLDKLHAMTAPGRGDQELLIWKKFVGSSLLRYTKYDKFVIGDEKSGFALAELGRSTGDADDSFRYHTGMKFSAFDVDNDLSNTNCAKYWQSGWWYRACSISHLTGRFINNRIIWAAAAESNTVQFAEMWIRARQK